MEEYPEVPTDHDQGRFCPSAGAPRLDPDEPLAVGDAAAGAVCDEP